VESFGLEFEAIDRWSARTSASSVSSTMNPKNVRRSLHIKDEDYRLSFLSVIT